MKQSKNREINRLNLINDLALVDTYIYASKNHFIFECTTMELNALILSLIETLIEARFDLDFLFDKLYELRKECK